LFKILPLSEGQDFFDRNFGIWLRNIYRRIQKAGDLYEADAFGNVYDSRLILGIACSGRGCEFSYDIQWGEYSCCTDQM
jgi:hypothetical protein